MTARALSRACRIVLGDQPGRPDGHDLQAAPDLKFADGSPLTVDDVKWSLERAANKETGGEFQFLLASIGGVETQGTDA